MSQHCSLSELDLSVNDLGQEGALLLCRALARPGCPIQTLGWCFKVTVTVCSRWAVDDTLTVICSTLQAETMPVNPVGLQGTGLGVEKQDSTEVPDCRCE